MSFIFRQNSQRRKGVSFGPNKSFSVRTGRDGGSLAVPGGSEPSRDHLGARHFLRAETQAAHAAVAALDRYSVKLASFQDKGIELIEEAHRALSRLEQAVATSAAPELIVVACEIKVAAHRGHHLLRTYGRYRYLGKLIALATQSSVTAKYDAVIARLKAIMPLESSSSLAASAGLGSGGGSRLQLPLGARQVSCGLSDSGSSTPRGGPGNGSGAGFTPFDRAATTSSIYDAQSGTVVAGSSGGSSAAAAAGVLSGMLKPSSLGGAPSSGGGGLSGQQPLAALLRSGAHDKVLCLSIVPPAPDCGGASGACVWWSVGGKLEFFSGATQSTTSFAAAQVDRAAIMAMAVDAAGNVWVGTSKGSVVMRGPRNWEQVLTDRGFSSCVRCLAPDADSDVVWAGDDAGRLAVFKCVDGGNRLECTATIMPGRAGLHHHGTSTSALDVKPRSFGLRRSMSCRGGGDAGGAEGPIRVLLVRDDRAWVAGGRTEPWIALFDAVLGTQLDMWQCGSYGSCLAMATMLTAAALAERSAVAALAAASYSSGGGSGGGGGGGVGSGSMGFGAMLPASVPEDGIGENPRSSWRLLTGHENGQLLIWNASSDSLQPLVKVGEAGSSPVRALTVLEAQRLVAVAHANGELSLFLRPARDEDWMLVTGVGRGSRSGSANMAAAAAAARACARRRRPSSSSRGCLRRRRPACSSSCCSSGR